MSGIDPAAEPGLIDPVLRKVRKLEAALAERDATIARVRTLHLKEVRTFGEWCIDDGFSWPCPTARALDGPP